MKARCNECKYYDNAGPTWGYCRLYPPKIKISYDASWAWPMVTDEDWCGQLKFPDAEME